MQPEFPELSPNPRQFGFLHGRLAPKGGRHNRFKRPANQGRSRYRRFDLTSRLPTIIAQTFPKDRPLNGRRGSVLDVNADEVFSYGNLIRKGSRDRSSGSRFQMERLRLGLTLEYMWTHGPGEFTPQLHTHECACGVA
jgi:hypothetical protein